MLTEIDFPKSEEYRTGTENEPISFYMDALLESKEVDLLLGYFSSSAINVLALGFAKFICNGGKLRMVINHILSSHDKEAILKGSQTSENDYNFSAINLNQLKSSLDEYNIHFFECLAWLVASKRLQIRVVKPKSGKGISHYKSGIFYDGVNKVKFKGSCNFTANGLLENLEELDIKVSWKANAEAFDSYESEFNSIFSGEANYIEQIPFEDIEAVIHKGFGGKEIDELLIQEQELISRKKAVNQNPRFQKIINKAISKIEEYLNMPKFPYDSGPRPYQVEAYQKWINNNYQGIFAMATGTGKTITSLNCLLYEYQKTNSYKAIILVPTIALLEQWKKECTKFNFKNILIVSSKENWNDNLAFFNTVTKFTNTSFIVIVTYASFSRPKFQAHFEQLPKDTLLIADEVHNMGSPNLSKLLPKIHLERRIGLSATPNRKYDEIGNESVETFFNDKPPFIYSYSMKQAMDVGALCKYTYYPQVVCT